MGLGQQLGSSFGTQSRSRISVRPRNDQSDSPSIGAADASVLPKILDGLLLEGRIEAARALASVALSTHGSSEVIKKYARILAPPKLVSTASPSPSNGSAEWDWLRSNAAQFRGNWVAVAGNELLGSSRELPTLLAILGDRSADAVIHRFE